MRPTELKSLAYAKLITRGLTVKLNHRVRLSKVKGYQQINLDIVALKDEKPFIAIYIGPRKERKLIKYRLTKVPFLELADYDAMDAVVAEFLQVYIATLY